jgi:hypothetical protein
MSSAPVAAGRARGVTAFDWLWLLGWAALSSLWCLSAATQLSATFDEPLYVARGLDAWRSGSHAGLLRLGTMPLPADLQTLPLYLSERWRGARYDPDTELESLLPRARAVTLGFWWLLLTYGWLTGRALAGAWGARLAVALLACEPSLLAHASLATTDVALAACLLALLYHFRAGREAAWWRRVGIPAAWFTAALLTKASALVIGPLCLVVLEVVRRRELAPFGVRWLATALGWEGRWGSMPPSPPTPKREQAPALQREQATALQSFRDIAAIFGWGLLFTFLICGSDWQVEPSFVAWANGLPIDSALRAPMMWLAEHLRIFSNAGEALVRQIRHNLRGHGSYLLGRTDPRALWYYFPVLLTIKLSEPLLLAVLLIAVVRRRALANWALLLAAVLIVYSLTFRVQLGIRMVLPLVAVGTIGVAAALVETIRTARSVWSQRALAALVAAAVVWNASTALAAWPHGLAYVNGFWGGAASGYRLVSDSNYDWGQGLKELLRWQRRRCADTVDVWYFGTDPLVRQPPLRLLPLHTMPITNADEVMAAVRGRLLAVSSTLLYGSALDSAPYHQVIDVLRARRPTARTTTFFIYDFRAE